MRRFLLLVVAIVAIPLAVYATTTFRDIGGVTFSTGAKFGSSGTLLEDSYVATLTTNFVGLAANTCKLSAAITLTGAATGDVCVRGIPSSETTALTFECLITGANEAKIKLCNPTAGDVASGTNPSTGVYTVRTLD